MKRIGILAGIWIVLILAPYWLPFIGGYTPLGTRVLVYGLAAMALNYLLGFTGVLSFGHAAYFGLGAYGAGMTIKYFGFGTIESIGAGVLLGTVAAVVLANGRGFSGRRGGSQSQRLGAVARFALRSRACNRFDVAARRGNLR